jgi:hypothetical protein
LQVDFGIFFGHHQENRLFLVAPKQVFGVPPGIAPRKDWLCSTVNNGGWLTVAWEMPKSSK